MSEHIKYSTTESLRYTRLIQNIILLYFGKADHYRKICELRFLA